MARLRQASTLRFFPRWDAYECVRCRSMLEVPASIRNHPEDRLLWVDAMTRVHGRCPRAVLAQRAGRAELRLVSAHA